VRDVRLGRNRRSLLLCIVDEKMNDVQRRLKLAEENQHLAEFRIWFDVERQLKGIQKALELAS
jgi:hypothetical protein